MLDLMIIGSSVLSFINMTGMVYLARFYFPEKLKANQLKLEKKQEAYKEISMLLHARDLDKSESLAAVFASEAVYALVLEMRNFDEDLYSSKLLEVTKEMRRDLGL